MRLISIVTPRLHATLVLGLAASLAACGGGDGGAPTPDAGVDAGVDAGPLPPDAIPCATDAECDDGATCTSETCNTRGFCEFLRQNTACSDDVFCNGRELCDPADADADPTTGCRPGPIETCSDDDVCTFDACDEEADACVNDPRDFDGDGDVDWFCDGGGDCDDRDPLVNGVINEICGDTRDNDCDGETDEVDCGRPAHDLCSDALDVSAGGTFVLSTLGAAADYAGTASAPVGFPCVFSSRPDVALRFTIDEAQDLTVVTTGPFGVSISLLEATVDPVANPERAEENCTTTAGSVECAPSLFFEDPFRVRALPAGTYYLLVQDWNFGTEEVAVTVNFDPATDPPSNETCAAPIDISAGGRFEGDLVDVANDISAMACSFASRDLAYTFTLDEPRNVDVRLASPTLESLGFEIRRACDDAATAVRCAVGAPAQTTLFSLPAGTYFLVVEGSTETDFELELALSEATPPPPGEDCSTPLDLPLDTPTTGTLVGRSDDLRTQCGRFSSLADAFYQFELTETKDVTVEVEGTGTMLAEIRSTCDDVGTRWTCRSGFPSILRRRRLPAGIYTLIVESFTRGEHTVTVRTEDPVSPTSVVDNTTCADAQSIPRATGGVFSGSTATHENRFQAFCGSSARSPDAVFELELTSTQRVIASTEGSVFDTVLHLQSGTAAAVCLDADANGLFDGTSSICSDNEDPGDWSLLDRTLGPGTHYFVVDGWGTSESGTYELDVLVVDP